MSAIWFLIKKNITILLRSKGSALTVIFAPLLIILILGLSYNTSSQFGLNIGVHSSSFTEDVTEFMDILKEEEFKIIKYESTLDECIEDIKNGFTHTCIEVPESFAIDGNTPKEITFYIDPSRINLVWMIQDTFKSKFDFKAQQVSEQLATDILGKLANAKEKVGAEKSKLDVVKEKNKAVSGSTESAKNTLTSVDLSVPTTTYDRSFLDNLSSEISEASQKIADAIEAIDETNLSAADKSSVNAILKDADEELDGAFMYINGTETNGTEIKGIPKLLGLMEQDLNDAKNKLTTAAGTISSTSSTLTSAAVSLGETVAAIDGVQAELSAVQADIESQKVTDAGTIAVPLATKIEKVSAESTYLNYLFPPLLILVVMFSSLLLGTTLAMMEKNSPAFFRNFFVPIRKVTFIASTYLTNVILIVIQIAIILGISLFFLDDVAHLLPMTSLVLFITASVFTFMCMTIGYLLRSEETGVLTSISLGSLLLFVSGVILPIESISPLLRNITMFNPFVIAERLIREIFIFNSPFTVIWVDLAILLSYAIALFLIILILESLLHAHMVERFMKYHHKQLRQKVPKKNNE